MAWKTADAATLEAELVAVAVEMEASMLAKLGAAGGSSPRPRSAHDLQVSTSVLHHQFLSRMYQQTPRYGINPRKIIASRAELLTHIGSALSARGRKMSSRCAGSTNQLTSYMWR